MYVYSTWTVPDTWDPTGCARGLARVSGKGMIRHACLNSVISERRRA